ncbi:pickpocket protein 11-like [Sitodiplosis mosellana]|uniref:pickpocket protein 11-like n=1 Tax=Sitodiplosis mosellana TaxID=263140 RepID=UPI002444830E|nr:pickpocket protein 11-like [Sitodiplosis mosellana]
MAVVFVYTLNDYVDSPVVINVEPTISNENSVFPAVSLFPHCNELFDNIQFNDQRYNNCSDLFKRQLVYGEGVCFTANSINFYDLDWDQLPLTYNKHQGSSKFTFDLFQKKGYGFHTSQVENDVDVRDLSIDERQCRFADERWPLDASLPYSFSACMIYTRVQIELERCNCTIHFAPVEYKNQYCNYEQMKCIETLNGNTLEFDHHHYVKPCLSACKEILVDFVGKCIKKKARKKAISYVDSTTGISSVFIEVNNKMKQLSRSARVTDLDLVITVGSIVGLFFGASLLSLVEIIYLWILHRF